MEKIIHFTLPEKLTPVQAQCVECARALHPTWEIKIWQDPQRPGGCLLEKYWQKANSGAQLSDLLRLDILYKWGGVYVDGDLRLLKPLDELVKKFDFFVASETGASLEGAIIGAGKAHPAIKALIDELLANEPDWSRSPDRTTGPDLFARILRWNGTVTVLPRETFYCYNAEAHSRKTHRHSYGEHLWAWSWKHLYPGIGTPTYWRSCVKRLTGIAKRVAKLAFITGFRSWHRIKSFDYWAPQWQPRFYGASGEIVIRTRHGFKIVADGGDTSLTPELVFGDYYEMGEENFCRRILHGGDWAIDVGAKLGAFCLLIAQRVGSFGRVFAYEPDPRTMNLLSKSAVMNLMHDRIVMRAVRAGEVAGNASLTSCSDQSRDTQGGPDETDSSIIQKTIKTSALVESGKINVPCVTLDQEFPIDLPIKLLRIDSDGQEVAVLKGARRLLDHRCIDFIVIKLVGETAGSPWTSKFTGSRSGEFLKELNRLTEANYAACTLTPDGSLIEHNSVTAALDRLEGRSMVLMARDQYISDGQVAP